MAWKACLDNRAGREVHISKSISNLDMKQGDRERTLSALTWDGYWPSFVSWFRSTSRVRQRVERLKDHMILGNCVTVLWWWYAFALGIFRDKRLSSFRAKLTILQHGGCCNVQRSTRCKDWSYASICPRSVLTVKWEWKKIKKIK